MKRKLNTIIAFNLRAELNMALNEQAMLIQDNRDHGVIDAQIKVLNAAIVEHERMSAEDE